MRKAILTSVLIGIVMVSSGCITARQPYTFEHITWTYDFDTSNAVFENKQLKFEIVPITTEDPGHVIGFNLAITNKSNQELKMEWENVYYINNNKLDGGFALPGSNYSRRNEVKHPTYIVLPNSTQSIEIYPSNLIFFSSRWRHEALTQTQGTYGVYAKLKINNREIPIKVTIGIKANKITITRTL